MKIRVVPARAHHATSIPPLMRLRDVMEIAASQGGMGPQLAIERALACSFRNSWVAYADLRPLAVFGLARLSALGHSGQVWCFGTRYIKDYWRPFVRESQRQLAKMHALCPTLTNYVDTQDAAAVRWLDFLGATYVLQPRPMGGRLFAQFVLARGQECQQGLPPLPA